MDKLQRLNRRPSTERGFTLIELLVVIIILGILAAVVVFAVSGVGDKGKSAATTIDERTIRTAQEAYCAQKGEYASGQALVAGGFLSELPEYHEVNASQTGGPCNGWRYSILRTAAADPYPPGRWDPVATPGIASAAYLVRLPDGRVLAGGDDGTNAWITKTWEPTTNVWTTVGSPPDLPLAGGGNTAILLTDDPLTPQNECRGAVVDNCGKVFLYGKYLYDPLFPAPGHPVEWERLPSPSTCGICNSGPSNFTSSFTFVQMKRSISTCSTTCGKIYIFAGPSTVVPDRMVDVYDPSDNSYTSVLLDPGAPVHESYATQLSDGRLFICCRINGVSRATFFDPLSLTYIGDAAVPPTSRWSRDGAPQPGPVLPNGDLFFPRWTALPRQAGVYTPQAGGGGSWRSPSAPNCSTITFSVCPLIASLADGRVLVTRIDTGNPTLETHIYNPATATWSQSGDLPSTGSYNKTSVSLDPAGGPCGSYCGKILIAGADNTAAVYTT